jgi:hypothetical protein
MGCIARASWAGWHACWSSINRHGRHGVGRGARIAGGSRSRGYITGGTVTRLDCGEIDVGRLAREKKKRLAHPGRPQPELRGGGRGAYQTGQWSEAPKSDFDDSKLAKRKACDGCSLRPPTYPAAYPVTICLLIRGVHGGGGGAGRKPRRRSGAGRSGRRCSGCRRGWAGAWCGRSGRGLCVLALSLEHRALSTADVSVRWLRDGVRRLGLRVQGEIVGAQTCRIVGKSQPVLDCDRSHYLHPHP